MHSAIARIIGAIAALLLASACGTPHAKRVDCDGKLEPINAPAPRSALTSEDTRSTKAERRLP